MRKSTAVRRGVPAAAALLALAASCGAVGDTGDRPDAGAPGEQTPAPTEAATKTPATTEAPATTETTLPAEGTGGDPDPDSGNGPAAAVEGECSFLTAMNDIQNSVFQIILDGPGGAELGTAFAIGGSEFLTAAHLVGDRTEARLRNSVADFPVAVIAADPVRDVALLQGDEAAGEGLRLLNSDDIGPGQVVASVGYPLFEEYPPSITGGLISRITEDRDLGLLIQTDTPINRGNSGGPLVDQCGRVVGMIIEKWFETGVEGLAWAIASNSLETAIADLRDGLTPGIADGALQAAEPSSPAVPAPSPGTPPAAFLDELAGLVEDIGDRIGAAGRDFDSGDIDAATQERLLWELAELADHHRKVLTSDAYDLGDSGRDCDLARRTYARALGWMSRWAGYRAAQVWSPGEYDAEVAEALRRSHEIITEATDHRQACAGEE